MKLATYADGTRDGHLVVVSHDLCSAVYANTQATRLQQLLDDWNFVAPQLHELYITLNHGKARHAFAFDPALCMAPLPRAGSWSWQALGARTPAPRRDAATVANEPPDTAADAAAAAGAGSAPGPDGVDPAAAVPSGASARSGRAGWTRPLLQCAAGDDMRGPCVELALPEGSWPAQVHAGLAVLAGELALQAGPSQALEAVRLLGLYSRWHLIGDAQGERGDTQLAPHWAPVLVTPDELGAAWDTGRVDLTLVLQWLSAQGKALGAPRLARGSSQRWHYGQLLAWACRVRRLRAGATLGCDWLSATLPGPADMSLAAPAAAPAPAPAPRRGAARAAAAEAALAASGPAWAARLEVLGRDGQSLFGQITPAWLQADAAVLAGAVATTAAAAAALPDAGRVSDTPAGPVASAADPAAAAHAGAATGPADRPPRRARKPRAGRPRKSEAESTIDPA